MWLHSLKVAQLLCSAACLHTNQSLSYLNHLIYSALYKALHFIRNISSEVLAIQSRAVICLSKRLTFIYNRDIAFQMFVFLKRHERRIACVQQLMSDKFNYSRYRHVNERLIQHLFTKKLHSATCIGCVE